MRRVLAFAVLSAALFVSAGCGGDSPSTGAGTNTPSAAATTGAATGDNTKEVCDAAEKAITDSSEQFQKDLTTAMTAASTGDQAAATQAVQALKSLFGTWATALRTEGARATSTELKTALTTFADEIEKGAAKLQTVADVQAMQDFETAEMKTASGTLERLCG